MVHRKVACEVGRASGLMAHQMGLVYKWLAHTPLLNLASELRPSEVRVGYSGTDWAVELMSLRDQFHTLPPSQLQLFYSVPVGLTREIVDHMRVQAEWRIMVGDLPGFWTA